MVPAPEAKAAPALNRPKTPPPVPVPAPVPVHVTPTPLPLPLLSQAATAPAVLPSPGPNLVGAASVKAPVRSVVTETVSTYVVSGGILGPCCRVALEPWGRTGQGFSWLGVGECVHLHLFSLFAPATVGPETWDLG